MRRALLRFLLVDGKISILVTPQGEPPTECMRFEISANSLLACMADGWDIIYRLFAEKMR